MHCISIQIQPGVAREFDREQFLRRARPIRSPEVDAYEEKGKFYLNFNFFTEFPQQLWQDLNQALYQDPDYSALLNPVSVVICEDEESGACLLLHHFDSNEKLDSL